MKFLKLVHEPYHNTFTMTMQELQIIIDSFRENYEIKNKDEINLKINENKK